MAHASSSVDRGQSTLLPGPEQRERLRRRRKMRDGASRLGVAAGGLGVIFALALIFLYLFYETIPLLKPVSMELDGQYVVQAGPDAHAKPLHLVLDRYETLGARFDDAGGITFFDANSGAVRSQSRIPMGDDVEIVCFGHSESRKRLFVYGFSDD